MQCLSETDTNPYCAGTGMDTDAGGKWAVKDISFRKFIRCYKWGFVGSILGWLEEDASYDLSTFYEELCKIFSGSGSGLDKISEKQD